MENRRSQLFVDKKLQLTVMLQLLILLVFNFVICLGIIYLTCRPVFLALRTPPQPIGHRVLEELAIFDQNITAIIIVLFLMLVSVYLIVGLIISHRVAGPIAGLVKCLQQMRNNGSTQPIRFRSNDYFVSLEEELNLFIKYVEDKNKNN